ncbi:MAG TPA: glycoside hydrolase family 16 protein [Pirellulales bacterium]|nr:glycoside hydrolase family 16 protein [Pirellulales bacterium]
MKCSFALAACLIVCAANVQAQHHHRQPPPQPAPPPTTPTPTTPAKLLFSSEFDTAADYTAGAAKKWNTSWPLGSGVNSNASPGEVQIYVDVQNGETWGPNPFTQGASMVGISATPTPGLPAPFTYTSGVLSTAGIFSFQYGYVEMRCMAPSGKGFWPSLWMMKWTGSWFNVVWPPEVDIFQFSSRINNEYYPAVIYGSGTTAGTFVNGGTNLAQAMHTYGFEWTASTMNWYFDGKLVLTQKAPAGTAVPMYLMLSLAVGDDGGWIGPPDGSTARWWIDYVRVYDKKPS